MNFSGRTRYGGHNTPIVKTDVKFCACGDHAWMPLTKGFVALVSPQHRTAAATRKWSAAIRGRNVYAVSNAPTPVYLHRRLAEPAPDVLIDHADGNALDCRLSNLRFATPQQNCANSRSCRPDLPKGVHWHKGARRWRAQFNFDDTRVHLGYFDTIEDAADAYNTAALKTFGEFARVS